MVKRTVSGVRAFTLPVAATNGYRLFPNPAVDKATFAWQQDGPVPVETITLQVYSASGKLILRKEGLPSAQFQLEKRGLPAGAYTYRISDKGTLLGTGQLIFK